MSMEDRILVLALRGRDAQVLERLLVQKGHHRCVCETTDAMARALEAGAGAALITEESLGDSEIDPIIEFLARQPPWSDFPFILLATKRAGRRPEAATKALAQLGNVVVLERPIHSETLDSAVNSALRVRRRQYEARRHLIELKQAEERQAELNSRLAIRIDDKIAELNRLWTLSEDMLARANYQGGLTAVSPAWTNVLGYSEQELLTRPYSEIIHRDDVPIVVAALNAMRLSGQPTRFENRILAADGQYKPMGWTVSPEPNGVHFIAIGRDLSVEKAREADLRQSQDQLRQAQKMEAVGQLTGGIAHDFNNLLQGITGSLTIVQKRISQGNMGDLDRWIGGAVTSANRAAALTHRLLAFSRRQPLDPKPVSPNPLIGSMADLLHRTMGENIKLIMVLADELWPTLCDTNQLENALLNLAINARDAMPDGGKLTIETSNAQLDDDYVKCAKDMIPGQYICIAVTDTGTGMATDVVERAFDPFFTTKAIGQGTGLGLSMIYGFIRQSGGHAKICSEVGSGTTITLYLPRHEGAAEQEADATGLNEDHAADEGEVVVVIEDEPVVRGLIIEVLAELGYQAMEAEDGPAGLALLESAGRVDLLVTDVGLPGLNGRQVADAARARMPDLKVLFMTGYAENAAVASGFLEPGMSIITKPFAMESLATRIRTIIEND